jgi:hypothetical protein
MKMRVDQELLSGLADAGCTKEEIHQFHEYLNNNDTKKGMKVLEECRKECLQNLHEQQRKIDTLDYLMYQLNKQ